MDAARELARRLHSSGRELLVVTGAGISLASGIPTFRGSDPGAIWKRDVTELGTRRYFRADPVGAWRWYLERFDAVRLARPNPAHVALAQLEQWHVDRGGDFLLITQNIDTLHEGAGSSRLVKVHGSADRVRCSQAGCPQAAPHGSLPATVVDTAGFLTSPDHEHLPCCPECGSYLRPHVLWFDEYYDEHDDYQIGRVQRFTAGMDLAVFIGTSLSVGVTEMILAEALGRLVPVVHLDPDPPPGLPASVHHLPVRAEEVLPRVCAMLGAGAQTV
jgi:NAD-dependent deacetylase